MIRSMTGFARREAQGEWGSITCELRAVNHRYLEMALRLPDEFKAVEPDVRQTLAAALRRGKIDAGIYFKAPAGSMAKFEVNEELTSRLVEQALAIGRRIGNAGPINPFDVIRWPGVIREAERDLSPALDALVQLVSACAQDLNAAREREGARIRDMILQRCAALRGQVANVRMRLPELNLKIRSRILERIAQLGQPIDPSRLEQEIVLYAHKMDVDEELDRLASHLTEIESIVGSPEPAGRRLDFLMQELNREANTLSSKSQDVETTRAAVEMKVIIEQLREQVQNVE